MKILELRLQAYGPFTDCSLDLSDGQEGLFLIYGLNEAGKSCALRALKALFYGIEERTTDAFVHPFSDLRIGGLIRHSDGTELSFVRRKARKNTLLDPLGKPLPDSSLDTYLRGIDASLFSSLFGINHEALVLGAQAILEGAGDVGQSLFAAGLGATNLRAVLKSLEDEAQALYKSAGSVPRINQTLSAYKEACRESEDSSRSSREWEEHERALNEAMEDRKKVAEKLGDRLSDKARLERIRKALPITATRKTLQEGLEAMQGVSLLPSDYPDVHKEATLRFESAVETEKKSLDSLGDLKAEIESITVPEKLLEEAQAVTKLQRSLGSHLKALGDLPGLQRDRQRVEAEARTLLKQVNPDLSLEASGSLRLPDAQRARIRDLGKRCQTLLDDVTRHRKAALELDTKCLARQSDLLKLPPPRDPDELGRAIDQARRLGAIEEELQGTLDALQVQERQAGIEIKKLGRWTGTLEELEALPVPLQETVDRFEKELTDRERKKQELKNSIKDQAKSLSDCDRQIQALERAGDVPSESQLFEARQRRETGWKLVRRAWLEGQNVAREEQEFDPDLRLPEAYEKSAKQADALADRLRREADRVARMAALDAQREACRKETTRLSQEQQELARQDQELLEDWSRLWRPHGIDPLSPREMRSWIQKQNSLVGKAMEIKELRGKAGLHRDKILKARSDLDRCLRKLGEAEVGPQETLAALLDRCESLFENIKESERNRDHLQQTVKDIALDQTQSLLEAKELEQQLERCRHDWGIAVQDLGLGPEAIPAEAESVLDNLQELFRHLDEANSLTQRVQEIERDARAFQEAVGRLVERLAPDLADLPADQAASTLNDRLVEGRDARTRLHDLKSLQEDKAKELQQAQETIRQMRQRLAEMCRQAGCSEEDLKKTIHQSVEKRSLESQIEELGKQLLVIGSGLPLEKILAETEQVDADSLVGQIDQTEHDIQDLEEQRSRVDERIGSERNALRIMDGSAKAAEAAEEAQSLLARIRPDAERFIRLRLASAILRQEIERYRLANQDPLLRRASELFSRLTLGSFSSLQADYDETDRPVLVGVRPSEEKVGVEGMSDGTRDQLYLCLRLASLERYLETNEPLPFIVDDILINLDNERAAAILKVLAELSSRTQVLCFTHHAHLVDLAKAAVQKDILRMVMLTNCRLATKASSSTS